jgi:putative spermidine/putrescine transport system substrate-binding protein
VSESFLDNYKVNRRELLRQGLQVGAALGVAGLGGLTIVGCGGGSEAPTATSAPSSAATTAPATAPATSAPSQLATAPAGATSAATTGEWTPSVTGKKASERKYLWENLAQGETVPSTGLEVRTIGLGVTVQDRFLNEFMRRTGHKASGKIASLTQMITEWLAGGYKNYDTNETNASRNPALWDNGLLQPIPVEKVIPWKYARDTFVSNKAAGFEAPTGWPLKETWVDVATQKEFKLVPTVYNCDGIGYRYDLIGDDITSWGSLVDPKFKGKVAIMNDSILTPGWVAGYLNKAGIIKTVQDNDLTKEELDKVIDWLIEQKKAGQFRVIWDDYGTLVNLLASGEVWLADAWEPVIQDVRKQGVAAKYASPKEGYQAWYIGIAVAKDTPGLDAVLDYVNFFLEGWLGGQVASQGYYSPTTTCEEYLKTMHTSSEKYNDYEYWYLGGENGDSPAKGWPTNGRDGGSYSTRWGNVMHWEIWPKEADYYTKRWNDFLSA